MPTGMLSLALAATIAVAAGATVAKAADMADPSAVNLIPPAKATGPIPVTATAQPFRGRALQLPAYAVREDGTPRPRITELPKNYVEEEYLISGEVLGQPYRTTLLVHRPRDVRKFSGTAILEPLHPFGAPVAGPMMWSYLRNHGHAYVMVVPDERSVEQFVKPSDAARYASISIPVLDRPFGPSRYETPGTPTEHVIAQRAGERQYPMSMNILSQAAALLKSDDAKSPLAKLKVRHVIVTGGSATGRLGLAYLRDFHPTARLADGTRPFDGFFPLIAPALVPPAPSDVPVVHLVAEADFLGVVSLPHLYRRDDSDTPEDRYRLYEVAGAPHGDFALDAPPHHPTDAAPDQIMGRFPLRYIVHAALDSLILWIDKGVAPPHAGRIEINPRDGTVVKDAQGNTKGGVRSTYLDVPVAVYTFDKPNDLIGRALQAPLPRETLARLYPTREDYVAKVSRRADELVSQRWLLPEDAAVIRADAEKVTFD